jgi:hypothetical protein
MAEVPSPDHHIEASLNAVRAAVARAETEAGRPPGSVCLVAVAKTHPAERIRRVIALGQRVFAENRVQEAEAKWPALKAQFPDIALHLVGPLQRNKVRRALKLFDVIESLDRPEIGRAVAQIAREDGHCPDLLIQVNTGAEPQKHGVMPADVGAFIHLCRDELRLPIRGLMCIPPVDEEPSLHFAFLRELARRHDLVELSMGMSADFPQAIRFGATFVRVGTAIFGERPLSEAAVAEEPGSEPPSINGQ